jgi:hypothetical protein
MINKIGILVVLFSIFLLISCDGLKSEHITERYYLVAVDSNEDMTLSYSVDSDNSTISVVRKTVFSVGYNDKYIIVKQHPFNNKKIINYFIVPIYKSLNYSPEEGVIGPLNLKLFEEKRKNLNISNIIFTKEIDDLK